MGPIRVVAASGRKKKPRMPNKIKIIKIAIMDKLEKLDFDKLTNAEMKQTIVDVQSLYDVTINTLNEIDDELLDSKKHLFCLLCVCG
jgi:ABC-type enterochelin transport system substrate-binding protein